MVVAVATSFHNFHGLIHINGRDNSINVTCRIAQCWRWRPETGYSQSSSAIRCQLTRQTPRERCSTALTGIDAASRAADRREPVVGVGQPPDIERIPYRVGAGLITMATRGANSLSRVMGSVAYAVPRASRPPSGTD